MSLGKPVIGTKIAGIPEQIDHQINGFLINPKDSDGLYDSILQLIDKDLRLKYGNESINKFNKNYTVEISTSNYLKLYKLN